MAKFLPGNIVINLLTKEEGVVCEVCPPARGRQLYRVRFNNSIESCLEQNLDGFFEIENPFERIRKGIYGNRDQFVLVNTTHKINNSNNNTISSLKASKTLFKAYQFKPLLKFLNSQTRRVLIADEVGLGKTIEAGHILLELKARGEFKTALIICPNSLKIKWQTELKEKFGLNFKIYESLNDAVEDMKAHPQNARGILNYDKIRAKEKDTTYNDSDKGKCKKKKSEDDTPTNVLIDFLHSGQRKYSIVLCDEAHKLRNNKTQTYRGMFQILDYADAAVFLTATPIMLGENDLYNLLHLLDPITYDNQEVFRNLINSNRPFVKAISMLNANDSLEAIKEVLTKDVVTKVTEIGKTRQTSSGSVYDVYKGIRLYERILNKLDEPDTPALRAQLQNDITGMSSINNVFSRTRKREVSTDERQQTERNAHKCIVSLNTEEREVYDDVINDYIKSKGELDYDIYGEEKLPKGAILGLIQRKRMVASCVNGYKLLTESDNDVDVFCKRVESEKNLQDAKIDKLTNIVKGVIQTGAEKLIVFSIFKFTVRYLEIQLKKLGYNVFSIHGDIKERESIIEQFKECKTFAILLSTEVGSEGLDMQFCAHLVNYDLPWNPMVVEQRIGRIDRFGQKAAMVHIYNLVVSNSIQEVIYNRLLDRIGVFQGVIGDLEMILEENGELFKQLEQDLYGMNLTPSEQERKIQNIERAIETQKILLEQVEDGMTNALTNDLYFQNEICKIRSHRLYVTEDELRNYIMMLVNEHLKTCTFEKINDKEYLLAVPKSTPKIINNFITENQPIGEDFEDLFRAYKQRILDDFQDFGSRNLTFDQEYAFEDKNIDYVNIYNPLIIAASCYFKNTLSSIGNTFQLKYKVPDGIELKKGEYFMVIYTVTTQQEILGKKISSETLVPVLYNVKDDYTITDEDLNMAIFGDIQEYASNITLEDGCINLEDDMVSNMESDFAFYISEYVTRKKEEINIRDDSQKELFMRQLNEYFAVRIKREEQNISNAQWSYFDEKDQARKKNILQLAENRLKMLKRAKEEAITKANVTQPPTISNNLVSLNRILLY